MFRFLCLLLLTQFVVGFVPQSSLRDDGEVDWEDVADENYDVDAELAKQDTVDKYLQAAIYAKTKQAGYPLEEHQVQTEDGYILTMHRLTSGSFGGNKPVVFLQHGLLSCSYHWLTQGPGKALAYILADEGFDVWMGNVRGNTYSKKHVKLSTKKSAFWDFSWHQIGYYDLPAMIDYVLANTKQSGLNYVGHSQGTTSFFVMASTRPEYNKKIKAMHALAPVAFMNNMANPFFRILGPLISKSKILTTILGDNEFLPSSKIIDVVGSGLCKDGSIFQGLCVNALFLIAGFSHENMNATMLPEIIRGSPSGASTTQIIHYAQGISSGKFRQWDYGSVTNLFKYMSFSPPDYNLGKITAPVNLYYSSNDWLASAKDVQRLAAQLPNLVYNKLVPLSTFNHLDFLWGSKAIDLVYTDLINNIRRRL